MRKAFLTAAVLSLLLLSCKKEDPVNHQLPSLTTIAPYDIESETATSGGSISSDGGAPVTARGVCWDTLPAPTIANNRTEDGTGTGDFTSNITGLTVGKMYYVRAYATNKAGTAYGNEEEFTSILPNSFTDVRDGNTYRTVSIGSQIWMAENLRYLPEVHSNDEFDHRNSPGYGVYGYNGNSVAEAKDYASYNTFGVMYNWSAAINACPVGWHLPSSSEWEELENFVKNDGIAIPGMETNSLKATYGWNCGVPGTDDYSFTALAAGVRSANGLFFDAGLYSNWWTDTEANFEDGANYISIVCTHGIWGKGGTLAFAGYYVRCVKD
jgi:uncharacterized protein (TIGR02145 family)